MKKLLTLNNIKWFATGVSFIGAMNIALNTPYSKYAFMIFLISSTTYMYAGYKDKDWPLVFLNVGFFIVDIVGIYRWFF